MWAGSVLVPVQDPDLDLDQVRQLENWERRLAQFPKSWQINSRSMYEKINRV